MNQFKDKKITIMGLGILGRGLQVTKFLAECGANLTVTDLKNKKYLSSSIKALKKYKIRYVLGRHDPKDFESADLIIKSPGVPLDSEFIKIAKSKNIPIAMDASLFAELVKDIKPPIKIIGITGTRGKSMTTALIYHILKTNEKALGCRVYLGGNMRMKATLPLIKKINPGDIAVLELDSWQCQGFGDAKISPHIAVFTSFMPDHMNYYKNSMKRYLADKSNIFLFQKRNDALIINRDLIKIVPAKYKGKIIIPDLVKISKIPLHIFGDHNKQNASYAYSVTKKCGLNDAQIQKGLKSFTGLEGRLECLRIINKTCIINDNNSTTPEATIAGIKAVHSKYKNSNIILIAGGADKKLELGTLALTIQKYCAHTILLPGTGTERLKEKLTKQYDQCPTLKQAVKKAFDCAGKKDIILFSPGFASFGLFMHEYDRNDQFIKIIRQWK